MTSDATTELNAQAGSAAEDAQSAAAPAGAVTSPYFPPEASTSSSVTAYPAALPHVDEDWHKRAPGSPTDSQLNDKHAWKTGRPDPYDVAKYASPHTVIPSAFLGVDRPGWEVGRIVEHLGHQPFDFTLEQDKLEEEYPLKLKALAKRAEKGEADEGVPQLTLPATWEELQLARPHPNALFSPQRKAWIIVTPLEFFQSRNGPAPDRCNGSGFENPIEDQCEPVHAMQKEEQAVDPRYVVRLGLDAVFGGPTIWGWPTDMQSFGEVGQLSSLTPPVLVKGPTAESAPPMTDWWDAWVCQCAQVGVIASNLIPFVFDAEFCDAFEQSREPQPGMALSKRELATESWWYIFRVLKETVLFGERRALPIKASAFTKNVGWNEMSQQLFDRLGYTLDRANSQLIPPEINRDTEESCLNRARLLRAWLEIGLSLKAAAMFNPSPTTSKMKVPYFDISAGYRKMAAFIGGNPITYADIRHATDLERYRKDYYVLGATPCDPDMALYRAYLAAYSKQRAQHIEIFTSFEAIATARNSQTLGMLVTLERSKGSFTQGELDDAWRVFDLLPEKDAMQIDGEDGVEVQAHITDERIIENYQARLTAASGPEEQRRIREAIELIKKLRSSELLNVMLDSVEAPTEVPMTLERARSMFGVGADVDDDLVQSAFAIALIDAPEREEELRKALEMIAEDKNSSLLRETARPQNTSNLPPDPNRPVGLRNFGNTCFLNSLLQYLFTIRELREVVLAITDFEEADVDASSTVSKRAGGRAVTSYEIERSKRFLLLLSQLFSSLITSSANAVTPERELEFLALETSIRADEPASAPLVAAGSDDTLVADPTPMLDSALSPSPTFEAPTAIPEASDPPSLSVLGKRRSEDRVDSMDVDSNDRTPLAARAAPQEEDERPPTRAKSETPESRFEKGGLAANSELIAVETADGVTEIGTATEVSSGRPANKMSDGPPKLPPRRQSTKIPIERGALLYGKQNDISECLDAILFKLEIALDANKLAAAGHGVNGNVVQKLFTGKIRQVLESLPEEGKPSSVLGDSVDQFNYLLVDAARDGCDLYDALDRTLDEDVVDWQGAKASRRYTAKELPPLLQIQLQRVQYDIETKRTFKSNAFMALPPVLRMDRYMDPDPADATAVEKRQRSQRLTSQLAEARERQFALKAVAAKTKNHASTADMLAHAANFLAQLAEQEPEEFLAEEAELAKAALQFEAERAREETEALALQVTKIKETVEELWASSSEQEYDLVSVFMHRGEANFGHYFLYQRVKTDDGEKWLKLNDEQVSEISRDEVFKESHGNLNPYWLAYVRRDSGVVEAVRRDLASGSSS